MVLKLNTRQANELADQIENDGGNADSLRGAIKEVDNSGNGHSSIPSDRITDEEYLSELCSKAHIKKGTDLECMICHDKFDYLISDTCEVCFREWVLATKPKVSTPRLIRAKLWK